MVVGVRVLSTQSEGSGAKTVMKLAADAEEQCGRELEVWERAQVVARRWHKLIGLGGTGAGAAE